MINLIYQKKNVLRGIHEDQDTYKLISCVYGKIFQVVVDCRINSKNFGKHTTLFIKNDFIYQNNS